MSCKRAARRDGFVLTCDDCGHQVGLATATAIEGLPLAARKGWTCGARRDLCPGCTRRAAAVKPKTATRGRATGGRSRSAAPSKR